MKDYKLSYLFQRPRIFLRLFSEFSKELDDIAGYNFETLNEFHQSLCILIENKIKTVEIHPMKNTPQYFTLTRRGLKKKLKKFNGTFSDIVEYVYQVLGIGESHVIDLSDALIDLLDQKLRENCPSYTKHREDVIVGSIYEMFQSMQEENARIYKNLYYSDSEIDLIIIMQNTIIFIEAKHTKQSKLRRLYNQLNRRSDSIKKTNEMELWNREKTFTLNLSLGGKETLFLGIIYDDPFHKMDFIDIDEGSLKNDFLFMTYFNLEAIIELIIQEQREGHLATFINYLNTRLDERKRYKMEGIGIFGYGDEVIKFKQFYFYNLDYSAIKEIYSNVESKHMIFDINYDIVDKKYDRINIQENININRPLRIEKFDFLDNLTF